ncbi:hypothetical protein BDK51DRAFT_26592, partial [Blyttiomyces helicus]
YFIQEFNTIFKSESATSREVSMVIRGIGIFAGPCLVFATKVELSKLFGLLQKKCALLCADEESNELGYVAAFMHAFANVGKELDSIDDAFLVACGSAAQELLGQNMYVASREILLRSQQTWRSKKAMVSNIFVPTEAIAWDPLIASGSNLTHATYHPSEAYQALVLTCSDPAVVESDSDGTERSDHAYKDYLHFWEGLFKDSTHAKDRELSTCNGFLATLYDETIASILRLPLNLSFTTIEVGGEGEDVNRETDLPTSGDISKLRAAVPKDFSIFVNFVGFCEAFLPRVRRDDFRRWGYLVGEKWIELSTKYPLVSGFYKLFGVCLQLCGEIGYFEGVLMPGLAPDAHEGTDDEVAATATDVQRSSYKLFTKYIKEVVVRSAQFKDDLLAASIRLALSAPLELTSLKDLVPPLQSALRLGLSHPPLAVVALDALETWITALPRAVISNVLQQILPGLADYLRVNVESGLELGANTEKPASGPAVVPRKTPGKPFSLKSLRRRQQTSSEQAESPLSIHMKDIRLRILHLLGKIGGDNRFMLAGETTAPSIVAWDPVKRMPFEVPFKDASAKIYLDDILPRVMELAERSPDRKTKVAAGELLHAMVLLMIGTSAHSLTNAASTKTEDLKEGPFHRIYLKVFPSLLRLSIDVDKVTRNLFRPLVMQLIHWLTKNSRAEHLETVALLTTCLDAATSFEGPLRDFGAECSAEFLKWSIKHTTVKSQEENPMNAKSLIKRIYGFCQHSNPNKRLGAALTFNRIYRIFREENALVAQFSFEILYYLLLSLKLADGDHSALGTKRQASNAIDHIAKIIRESRQVSFIEADSSRRLFPGLTGSDLQSLTVWLFHEIGTHERIYAQKCMELFMLFVTRISTEKAWMEKQLAVNPILVKVALESKLKIPSTEHLGLLETEAWLVQIAATIEGYVFLLDAKLVDSESILAASESALFPAIHRFLQVDIPAPLPDVLTPSEIHRTRLRKAFVVVKLLALVECLLARNGPTIARRLEAADFWSPPLLTLIANCTFTPSLLGPVAGFDMESQDVKEHLPERMTTLLGRLVDSLSDARKIELYIVLADTMFSPDVDLTSSTAVASHRATLAIHAAAGVRILQVRGILGDVVRTRVPVAASYFEKLYQRVQENRAVDEPIAVVAIGGLLEICLAEDPKTCFKELLGIGKRDPLNSAKDFYERFSRRINIFIARNFRTFTGLAQSHLDEPIVLDILAGLLDFLIANKASLKLECVQFMAD